MALSSRRRKAPSDGEAAKYVAGTLLGVAALGLFGLIGWYYLSATNAPVLDKVTLCPADGPAAVTSILLDSTDKLPEQAGGQIKTRVLELAGLVPKHGLLEFRLLDASAQKGVVLFGKCSPGDGSDANPITQNPDRIRKRWAEFVKALEASIAKASDSEKQDSSPIMEAIQEIAIDRFETIKVDSSKKQLVVISDMIQNGSGYSQYSGDLSYDRFKQSPAYRQTHTDLTGAGVTIFYIQRGANIDRGKHMEFWLAWIKDNGGAFEKAEVLQGVN